MLKFFLTFTLLIAGLFLAELLPVVQRNFVIPWTTLLAQFCAALVTAFDSNVFAYGKVIQDKASGLGISIEAGCNGVEATIILFAAILAFPAPWKHRFIGLAIGVVAIQAVNVVRIITLFYLHKWDRQVFEFAHAYVWQALIMLDVLIVWLLWLRALPHNTDEPAPTPALA